MSRKQKKYHFIYKTTNLINNKFYVGMHSTDDLEDGYFGSGKIINYSVNKHGIENHKVEILEFVESREALRMREAELVNEELLNDPLNMNLKYGGEGGWDHIVKDEKYFARQSSNGKKTGNKNLLTGKALINALKDAGKYESHIKNRSNAAKKFMSERGHPCQGKSLSNEHKSKIGKITSEHQSGLNNSQFGTCWINDGITAKKIKKEELQHWLDRGWSSGRKCLSQSSLESRAPT